MCTDWSFSTFWPNINYNNYNYFKNTKQGTMQGGKLPFLFLFFWKKFILISMYFFYKIIKKKLLLFTVMPCRSILGVLLPTPSFSRTGFGFNLTLSKINQFSFIHSFIYSCIVVVMSPMNKPNTPIIYIMFCALQ